MLFSVSSEGKRGQTGWNIRPPASRAPAGCLVDGTMRDFAHVSDIAGRRMPTLNESFAVTAGDHVWEVLRDLNQLIPLVPGARLLSAEDSQHGLGEITVKMGSMGMVFRGPVDITAVDASTRTVAIRADTKDEQNESSAVGNVTIEIAGDRGTIVAEADVSGKAASMGEGTVVAVLTQLTRQFAANLSAHSEAASEAVDPPSAASRAKRVRGSAAAQESSGSSSPETSAEDPFDLVASAVCDLPATEDLLGFTPLIRALHALLDDTRTALPLAISVTARWGAGKSSVMRQLKALLDAEPSKQLRGGGTANRRWKTVRFDAWKYERGERLWAALVKAIYDQSQDDMSLPAKLKFRARLERRRLGLWKMAAITVAPLLLAATALSAALSADVSRQGTAVAGLSAAALVIGAASRYGAMLVNPFRRAIEKHATRPDYKGQLGFTSEADAEVRLLVRLLAPGPRDGLAVFVDDLDRCSSAHVVEVVEAMNQIFNAAEEHNCVFILGLDRDVVATNIDVAYGDTVAQLKSNGNALGDQFGSEFLAKLVQLSVAIPPPDPSGMHKLMEAITGSLRPEVSISQEDIALAQDKIRDRAIDRSLESVAIAADDVATTSIPTGAVRAAKRRERAQRIKDSPDVVAAEFAALPFLEPNPRQVKRFHNAFRLQLYVASEDDRVTFDFSLDQLLALARWVALRLRWPRLADDIAREPALLTLLECEANDERAELAEDTLMDLRERHGAWLAHGHVLALMREPNGRRRLSALRLDAFVRVA